jgi:phospholipase/carboxylesterase
MDAVADLEAVLRPLLRAMDRLAFIGRHLHLPHVAELLAAVGAPEADIPEPLARLELWPEDLIPVALPLQTAAAAVLEGYARLRGASEAMAAYRGLRKLSDAQEALWPLASALGPVSRYFIDEEGRADRARLAVLEREPVAGTGVFHIANGLEERGGYSLYVPEDHDPARPAPFIMALHGGSGHGRSFLWSWLPAARAMGAIVATPTSTDRTWALSGSDGDTPNLNRILAEVEGRWAVDPARRLLTGMSDGGTFTYVSGLEPGSRFTHLAPIAAAFHPMLAAFADAERLRNLPIFITHGVLDWMFDVEMARQARDALARAGARVEYREIDDLSHTYPREINRVLIDWMA